MLKRKEEEKRPSVPKGKEVLCVMSYIFVQCDSKENRKRNERKSKEVDDRKYQDHQ